MKFEKRTRPLDTGYFSKDLFWWEGVFYTYIGSVIDGEIVVARAYKHPNKKTCIVAIPDDAISYLNDPEINIFEIIEKETGLEGTWQVWEANRGRWQS